jgi:uncharacterized caspase-like protein
MMRFACLIGLLAIAFAVGAQQRDRTLTVTPKEAVAGEARHALVIGNGAYTSGPLRNPVNDARAMAKALGETGFHVILLEDASQAAIQRAIRTFGNHIAKGGIGLFYYAGHGLQVKGRNYLVPVNADIAHEDEIEFSAVDVGQVLAKMDTAKNPLNIVILDACRNNPFQRSFRSAQAGLAQIDAPSGTFIAFATAPGSVAADGTGDNGVYTKHLLAEMVRPGVPLELMFRQVRNGVMSETKGRQTPWESSSLRGEFAFRPGVAAPSVADAVAEAVKRERQEMEKMLQAALDRQRKELEGMGLKPAAMAQSTEITFWESIKASVDAADFRAYLDQYPKGRFAALAKNRIAALEKEPALVELTAPAAPPTVTASIASTSVVQAAGSRLPQRGDLWTYRVTEPNRAPRTLNVTVGAASPAGILEHFFLERGGSGDWAHTPGNYLVAAGLPVFSPYLAAFQELAPGTRLRGIEMHDRSCTGFYRCEASGKVVGNETITVPAGRFDTVKVALETSWVPTYSARGGLIVRDLTVWYAPAVKRAVKFTSRASLGKDQRIATDFELELTNYTLK